MVGAYMKKRLKNLSIQQRISYSFIFFFTVLVICIIFVLRGIYSSQMYEKLIQGRNYEDNLIVQQMAGLASNTASCCNSIIVNLNNTLELNGSSLFYPNLYNTSTKKKILNIIENSFLLYPDVGHIAVLYNNGDMYEKERNRSYRSSDGNLELVRQFGDMGITTTGQWYYSLRIESAFSGFNLHYVKVLRDVESNADVGYIILELDEQRLYETYQYKDGAPEVDIYLTDKNGMLLSSDDREAMRVLRAASDYNAQSACSEEISSRVEDKKAAPGYRIGSYQVNDTWRLTTVLDVKASLSAVNNMTLVIIGVSLLLLCVFNVLSIAIARRIARPISQLSGHMRKFTDSLPENLPETDAENEEGILISSFNQMVCMNRELFEKVTNEKKEKRRLELALLQAQIKPHFLYNTLDTIFCLNSMECFGDASRMIKLLADYYRLVLNKGLDWVWMDQELEALQKYLEIQSVRYNDSLSYSIEMPEELRAFKIPKLTLQPLIENAIYHGIKPKNGRGHILVTGELVDDWAYIYVVDDGIGMSRETFGRILSGEQKETDTESFGLKNVSERLKIFYGRGTCIQLDDTPIGTSIALCINLKRSGGHEV
ncbi:histidine kinase [Lachnospiraceae bacterium]|nr:histidine kinase [Lachnospiraceae bacterium]GKH44367.1 histidine kinase [Lachnospiraceae bacterium]